MDNEESTLCLILGIINDICHLIFLTLWPSIIAIFVWLGRNRWLCGEGMERWYDWCGYLLWGLIAFQLYHIIKVVHDIMSDQE